MSDAEEEPVVDAAVAEEENEDMDVMTALKVALKKATDSLNLYQVFLNQLIVALFICVFLGVVVYKKRVRRTLLPARFDATHPRCARVQSKAWAAPPAV